MSGKYSNDNFSKPTQDLVMLLSTKMSLVELKAGVVEAKDSMSWCLLQPNVNGQNGIVVVYIFKKILHPICTMLDLLQSIVLIR